MNPQWANKEWSLGIRTTQFIAYPEPKPWSVVSNLSLPFLACFQVQGYFSNTRNNVHLSTPASKKHQTMTNKPRPCHPENITCSYHTCSYRRMLFVLQNFRPLSAFDKLSAVFKTEPEAAWCWGEVYVEICGCSYVDICPFSYIDICWYMLNLDTW